MNKLIWAVTFVAMLSPLGSFAGSFADKSSNPAVEKALKVLRPSLTSQTEGVCVLQGSPNIALVIESNEDPSHISLYEDNRLVNNPNEIFRNTTVTVKEIEKDNSVNTLDSYYDSIPLKTYDKQKVWRNYKGQVPFILGVDIQKGVGMLAQASVERSKLLVETYGGSEKINFNAEVVVCQYAETEDLGQEATTSKANSSRVPVAPAATAASK